MSEVDRRGNLVSALTARAGCNAKVLRRGPALWSEALGVVVRGLPPVELAAFLKAEMDKWGPLIKEAGITGAE
jgi:hypothetical protein